MLRFLLGLGVAWFLWMLLYALPGYLSGASSAVKMFFQDLPMYVPGGRKRRGELIKEQMGTFEHGSMLGRTRSFQYQDIREHNLYEEVADEMLSPVWYFWLSAVVLPAGVFLSIVFSWQ